MPDETQDAQIVTDGPLNARRATEYARRRKLWDSWQELKAKGIRRDDAARALGIGEITLWRLERAVETRGNDAFHPQHHLCGRRPDLLPTDKELECVRQIYVKLNESTVRGRGLGSTKVGAYRLAAKSSDDRIGEEFRRVVLKRKSKTLPPTWERLLDAPASVLQKVREDGSTFGSYISTPRGLTYVNVEGEEKAIRAGTITESDDGTINFPCVVPWPFGGDKCTEKYGVKVGRFQLLPAIDVRTRMCTAFDVVIRAKSSYRGEDATALFGRLFEDIGMPEVMRLERGSWESDIVRSALKLANVPVFNAWHSKQKNAVENFFDRLWTPLSLMKGDVGRYRGDNKENTDLVLQCQEGRRDPREHFPTVEEAIKGISGAVEFVNSEPIESKNWGRWIPQQLYIEQGGKELRKMDGALRIFFSREQRTWTVRQACLGGKVPGPLIEFPVYFQCAELWEFEGCKVKCYFDPYASAVTGTLVLQDNWRGLKPGHVIARDVPALDLPPQIVLAADWAGAGEHDRSLQVRKAISKAVRTETWNWLGKRTSEARDGLGNVVIAERGRNAEASAAPARQDRPQRRESVAVLAPASRERVAESTRFETENALDFV
ncbi:MAG: hypothetical protein V4587_00295 [Acidobacteriota bacterium]